MTDVDHTFAICAYGESPYLEDCIQSILKQSVKGKLFIYTSTDNEHIRQIATKYAIKLHLGRESGIGKDWNKALSFVDTTFATIAHQDDVYEPEFLEYTLKYFSNNVSILFTDYSELRNQQVISKNTNLVIKRILLKGMMGVNTRGGRKRFLSVGNPICCPAVTYNLKKLTAFQFDEQMKTNLDWYAWYQINEKYDGKFIFIDKKLMLHRIHEESETSKTIGENIRTKEDYDMLTLFWPKWVAKLVLKQYVKSQHSNKIN